MPMLGIMASSTPVTLPTGGTTWTNRASVFGANFRSFSMGFGNGVFYCGFTPPSAGSGNVAYSSANGTSWTARTLTATGDWEATAGNSSVASIANYNSTVSNYSTNAGVTWTAGTLPSSSSWWSGAANSSVLFYEAYGAAVAATSPDGITWTSRTVPSTSNWSGAGASSTQLVITGSTTVAAYSSNGTTWTAATRATSAVCDGNLSFGTGVWVAAYQNTAVADTSADGITWTARTLPASRNWRGGVFAAGNHVTWAYNTSNAAYSADGITWTAVSMGTSSAWTFGATDGTTIAVQSYSNTQNVITSP